MIGIFKHLKLNQIFKQALLVLSVWLLAFSVKGDTVQLGDLAPRGAIDGQLNVGDLVIMQRLVSGITVPTADELIIGDVAPLGASDGLLNAADFLILQRAILGQVTLGTVIIAPPAPTLDPVVISPTNENPYTVSGTSVADAVVDIYLNSALATTTTALPDGSFSTTIVLAEGLNTIEATANTGGDTSALSTAINVDFQLADGGTLSGNVGGMALATNTRYIVTADITVDANQTLVIEQGAELRFAANAGINVADYLDTFNASLQVNGTAQNPVVFTSDAATPAVGDWKGIVIGYGGSSVLDGLVIEYAVVGVYYNNTDYYYENVPSYTGYPLMNTLTNSIIRNNITGIKATGNTTPLVNGNGIYSNGVNYEAGTTIWGTSDLLTRDATGNWWGTADPAVIAASITDYYDSNDSYSNGLVDFSGFLSAAGGTSMGDVMPPVIIGTKTYNSGSVYVISDVVIGDGSSVYPNLNASLVINAGVEVRITGNYAIKASDFSETYSASLTINGTVENPVVFTSEAATPAAGDWQGIEIGYGSSSTIDNALIEYAAIGIYYNDSDGYAGSALVSNTLNNSIVRNNTTGIKASGRTSPDVTGNQITGNTVYYDASTAAVYDGNIKVLNATGNWWGTNDPAIIAAAIDDYYDNPEPYTTGLVDFSGFLNAAGGASMGAVMPPIISGTKTYNSGKVYVISDVLVRDNTSTTSASLTFNAGVEVRVAGNYKITASSFSSTMSSIITVAGTATDPVVFTSNQSTPAAGDWQGIEIGRQGAEFGNGYASIQIDNAVIEYATDGIYFNYAYPVALSSTVSNSIIRYNTNGIHVYNDGAPLVQNNEIYANEKGLYVHNDPAYPNYNSSPTIVNNNSMHTNTWNYFAENMQRSDNGSIPVILNARDNWWGTADPFAIAATIYDYYDVTINPLSVDTPIVEYSGFLDAPGGSSQGEIMPINILEDITYDSGPVYVVGDVNIGLSSTLTINAGVEVRVMGDYLIKANSYDPLYPAAINVNGTVANPVVFTSDAATPAMGDWQGIEIVDRSSAVIDHAVIEYAVNGVFFNGVPNIYDPSIPESTVSNSIIRYNTNGIQVLQDGTPQILNNEIYENMKGLYVHHDTTFGSSLGKAYPVVNGNAIYSNVEWNYFTNYMSSGTGVPLILDARNNWWGTTVPLEIASTIYDIYDSDYLDPLSLGERPFVDFGRALDAQDGNPLAIYFHETVVTNTTFSGDVYVFGDNTFTSASTLTVAAGSNVYFYKDTKLNVEGNFSAIGAPGNEISFMPMEPEYNRTHWKGIRFAGAGTVNVDYCSIRGAVHAFEFDGPGGSVSNCFITENDIGVYIRTASPVALTNDVIVDNNTGVYFDGTYYALIPDVTITNSDIYNNTNFNLEVDAVESYNFGGLVLTNIWWGTDDTAAIQAKIRDGSGSNMYITDAMVDASKAVPASLNNTSALLGFAIDNVYISPTISTGVQDSATISGSFSGTPSWSIQIKDAGNNLVKTFTGTTTPVSVAWLGDNEFAVAQPDGVYSVNVFNNSQLVGRKFVVVDNTVPNAAILNPVPGNLGIGIKLVDINTTASDANFQQFKIEKAHGFTPAENDYVMFSTINDPVVQAVAYQYTWQFIDPVTGVQEPLGDKTIRLSVTDKAGNSTVITVPITIDYISILNVSHSTSAMQPVLGESVDVTFTIEKPATVTLNIYNELNTPWILPARLAPDGGAPPGPMNGFVMGQILMAQVEATYTSAGTYTINWDGKDASGNYVSQDAYRYEIEAVDAEQSNVYYKPILQVNFTAYTKDPWVPINLDEVDFSQNKYVKATTTVEPGDIVRKFIHLAAETPPINVVLDEGTYSFMLDGRDRDGRYIDESFLIAYDIIVWELALSPDAIFVKNSFPTMLGTEALPNVEIKSDPYFVEHSYDQVSRVEFTVDEASYITVKLLEPCNTSERDENYNPACTPDPDAASTIILIDNQLKPAYDGNPANVISFEWRGYDFEAPAADTNNILVNEDGLYTYLITATSALNGNTTTYRGALQLKQ